MFLLFIPSMISFPSKQITATPKKVDKQNPNTVEYGYNYVSIFLGVTMRCSNHSQPLAKKRKFLCDGAWSSFVKNLLQVS